MKFPLQQWIAINTSPHVLSWISEGFPLHFWTTPTKYDYPNRTFTRIQETFLDQEICELLQCGSIQEVSYKEAHCILPLSVVQKKGKKFCMVLDS